MPRRRSTLRATSTMRTCRFTWVGDWMFIRFTTRVGSSTNWLATWTALAASSGVFDGAGQHQRLVDGRRGHALAGRDPAEALLQGVDVVGDADHRRHQHVVVVVDREERGLADADAGQVEQPRRLDLDVGHLGVGDEEAGELLRRRGSAGRCRRRARRGARSAARRARRLGRGRSSATGARASAAPRATPR